MLSVAVKSRPSLLVAGLLVFPAVAFSAQSTWTGASPDGTGLWSDAANWTALPASSRENALIFGAAPVGNIALTSPTFFSLNSLLFTADAPAYTVTGGGLDFLTTQNLVNPSIVMNSNSTVHLDSLLRASSELTVSGTGSGELLISNLFGTQIGTDSLTKTSSGILTFTGSNSLGGSLKTNAGQLNITDGGTLSTATAGSTYLATLGSSAGTTGRITVGGGTGNSTWNNNAATIVAGSNGQGYLTVISGGSVLSGSGSLGEGASGYGEVTLGGGASASSWTNTGNLLVGNRGGGLLTIKGGGTVSSAVGILGNVAGSTGSAVIGNDSGDASWINSAHFVVGQAGSGTLLINGGGKVTNTTGYIAYDPGSQGSVTVQGGSAGRTGLWVSGSDLNVATSGTGSLTIKGGGTVRNSSGLIGISTAGKGTVNVGDGTGLSSWENSGNLFVGVNGQGALNISGGGSVSNGTGTIGDAANSIGSVAVGGGTGASSWTNRSNLYIGNSGQGSLTTSAGGSITSAVGIIGNLSGSTGSVTVDGDSTWTNSAHLVVGQQGSGTLNITGGGTVKNTASYIAYDNGSTGTVNVGDGSGLSSWINDSAISVGYQGAATLNIGSGGLVQTTGLEGGNTLSSVNLNGGTLRITQTGTATNQINLQSQGGIVDVSSAATVFTVSSVVKGAGGLTKTGDGTLVLPELTGYAGTTTVNGGTLQLQGHPFGDVVVNPGGNFVLIGFLNYTPPTVTLAGGSYTRHFVSGADLAHRLDSVSSFAGGAPDTTAIFRNGSTVAATTISSSFSDVSGAGNDYRRLSDIYSLSGMAGQYTLQLSITGTIPDAYLAWLDPASNTWVNAVNDPENNTGAWGVSTAGGVTSVWATVDGRSGQFAMIPECSTSLLVMGAGFGLLRRRRQN